jgi:hypothetical protein
MLWELLGWGWVGGVGALAVQGIRLVRGAQHRTGDWLLVAACGPAVSVLLAAYLPWFTVTARECGHLGLWIGALLRAQVGEVVFQLLPLMLLTWYVVVRTGLVPRVGAAWWALLLPGAAALGLRLTGIYWGNGWGHPDEVYYFTRVRNWFLEGFELHWVEHPPGYLLLVAGAVVVYRFFQEMPLDPTILLLGREITALLGAGTAVVLVLGGRLLGSLRAGVLAGLLLAVVPLHVVNSHYFAFDVPCVFWMTAALVAGLFYLERPSVRSAALAGALVGVAFGTKYTGLFGLFPLAAALLLHVWKERRHASLLRHGAGAAGGILGGLVFAFPFLLLDPTRYIPMFIHDFQQAGLMAAKVQFFHFAGLPGGYWYHPFVNAPLTLGLPLCLFIGVGLVVSLYRPDRRTIYLWSTFLPIYLNIGRFEGRYARYLLPMLPALLLLSAWQVERLRRGMWSRKGRGVVAVLVAAVVLWTGLHGWAMVVLCRGPDPRFQAAEWLNQHLPPGASIGLLINPCGLIISDKPELRHTTYEVRRAETFTELLATGAEYLVCSDLDFRHALRLEGQAETYRGHRFVEYIKEAPLVRELLEGRAGYGLCRRYERQPSALGIDFSRPSATQDWRYLNPTVYIFRRDG